MKTATAGLATALSTAQSITFADCWLITLQNGAVARLTTLDADVPLLSNTYVSNGPLMKRGRTRLVLGLEVDTLDLTITPQASDVISGLPWLQAAAQGLFDNAQMVLYRAVIDRSVTFPLTLLGSYIGFSGKSGNVVIDRESIVMKVNSDLSALSLPLPRNSYCSGCSHSLFDAGCAVNRATYTTAGTVASGSTPTLATFRATIARATGYYDLGYIVFTSGVNNGLKRTVKSWVSGSPGTVELGSTLKAPPAIGDTFNITAGCDLTYATCGSKFSNQANYRGFHLIPAPEMGL